MSSSVCKMSNQCTKSLTHHLKIVAGHCKYDCITIPPSYHDFSTRELFRRKGNARKIFGNFTWYHSHGTWYHHTLYNTPTITTFTYHRSRSAHQRMSSSESFECVKYMTHHSTIIAWHRNHSSSVCKMSNQCTKSLTHHLKIVAGHCKYDCITIPPSYHDFSTRELFRRKGNARKIFGNFTWYHSHGTWYHHTLYNTPTITTFTYHRSRSAHQRMSSSESFECAKYMTHHLTIIAWHRNHDRIAISTSCHDFSTREFGCSKGNAHIFLYTSQQNLSLIHI